MPDAKNIERNVASTPGSSTPFRIDYDARLVEAAVLLTMASHADRVRFRLELDRLYDVQDVEERDSRFRAFHSSWFVELELGQPLEFALGERPIIARSTRCCFVIPAQRRLDECAELFAKSSDPQSADCYSVGLRLQAKSLLDSAGLLALLRHEFLHIADMLDPGFEYEPTFSPAEVETIHPSLFQERYRALWDATIDGRLSREGWVESSCRVRRLRDFAQTFPMLGTQTESAFTHFFDNGGHTHPQLLAYALAPEKMLEELTPAPHRTSAGAQ